ncbi:MAG: phage tail protein [Lachnospiraceae bacterium]
MAKLGNWGSYLKFETSDKRILSFTGFKREVKARTVIHTPIRAKPIIEFLGSELQSITFTITLNASWGVSPKKIEKKLIKCIENGMVAPLVIGKRSICKKAMLLEMSESYGIVLKGGEVYSAQMDLTMTEYR